MHLSRQDRLEILEARRTVLTVMFLAGREGAPSPRPDVTGVVNLLSWLAEVANLSPDDTAGGDRIR